MNKYDAVIIGSGLGGLLSGFILSKEGMKVCILEQNSQIGGCLQNFTREGCIFDSGAHYIGGLSEGQNLHQYFKYFGLIDKLNLKKLDDDCFDLISLGGKDYKYATGFEQFSETMKNYFPKEKEAIDKYCNKLIEITDSFPLYNLNHISEDITKSRFLNQSISGFLDEITTNTTLKNVLAGSNVIYAGIENKTPLYMHALAMKGYIDSAWRVVDGSSNIANIIADSIIQNGGKIFKNSKVVRLASDSNKIKYAELETGEQFEADNFISNIYPANTLDMINHDSIRKVYRDRINSLENTISVFSLYIVLKKNTFEYLNYNVYHFNSNNVWTVSSYDTAEWPEGYMLLTPISSKTNRYADCITVLTYMKYDEVKKWENSTIGQRGNEYIEFKNRKAEIMIDSLEKKFPGIRSKIKSYYTSSPLTYRDYIGTREGALYGINRDCNETYKYMINPRTKIPNLFFTGQNINLHGVFGVTIGSVLTCAELLGINYIVDKIRNA